MRTLPPATAPPTRLMAASLQPWMPLWVCLPPCPALPCLASAACACACLVSPRLGANSLLPSPARRACRLPAAAAGPADELVVSAQPDAHL